MKTMKMGVALMAIGLAATPAMAGLTAVLSNGHGSAFGSPIGGVGGYYTATLSGTLGGSPTFTYPTSFRTFCTEAQPFHPGTTYNATIDTQVLNHGPKTLQAWTKNLYANFAEDIGMVGWNSIGTNGNKNRAIQALIWDYQGSFGAAGYQGVVYGLLTATEKTLYNNFHAFNINAANANAHAANVRALNLWSGTPYTGGDIQTQLILTTPLQTQIPAPQASALVLVGFGLLTGIRRRLA